MLPAFLEFARGAVLVAHNAPFDIGFLKAACARARHAWPRLAVVDTAVLARRVLTRDEVPNCKLATLAAVLPRHDPPDHRALDDARATVDVLHGLIARLGDLGVHDAGGAAAFTAQVDPDAAAQAAPGRRPPAGPGVYIFRDAARRAALRRHQPQTCAPGCAVLRRRRDAQPDGRDGRPVAERVDPIECAHALEAAGPRAAADRRAQAAVQPAVQVPRAGGVAQAHRRAVPAAVHRPQVRPDDGAAYLGPVRRDRRAAERPSTPSTTPCRCASAPTGSRCAGVRAGVRAGRHRPVRRAVRGRAAGARSTPRSRPVCRAWSATSGRWSSRSQARSTALSAEQRYEEAAMVRDRIADVVRACARMQRLASLAASPSWSRPGRTATAAGSCPWSAAAGWSAAGRRPAGHVGALDARRTAPTAETPTGPDDELAALAEETECILRWLEEPGTRLVERTGAWSCPAPGAGGLRGYLAGRRRPRRRDPFADRRSLGTSARPGAVTADAGCRRAHR